MTETEGGFFNYGEVPVKPEYLVKNRQKENVPDKDISESEVEPALKRSRLQAINKSSKVAQSSEIKLCSNISRDIPCQYGDGCKYSHDVEAYLVSKPKELGTECPNVAAYGYCKYGIQCRFSKEGHVDMHSRPNANENIDLMAGKMYQLKKKKISFSLSNAFMDTLKKAKAIKSDADTGNVAEGTSFSFSAEKYPFGERKRIDFTDKLYLAPLTTVGNLPYRRICKEFGVDITCGEMAMVGNLLKGQPSEWALLKRHPSEDIFGVQVCGGWTDSMTQAAEFIDQHVDCDFIDINMGCPIDIIFTKGMGSGLMDRTTRVNEIITGMSSVIKNKALTVKMRMGIQDGKFIAHKLIPKVALWGASAVTVHGRTRQQRYTKEADWSYISQCVDTINEMDSIMKPSIIGNGDVLSWEEYEQQKVTSKVNSVMIARGALVKPWIFTEIKERRHWDISSSERFEILKKYARYGLEHFGSDTNGVEKTRRFLLEWLSFLCRYVPVGLMERLPQKINQRPPAYYGRDELETLMASDQACDWIEITERLLGKAPEGFKFEPKHKSNSYGVKASDRL